MIPKVCIVGAGPAGFYTAQHVLKLLKNVQVDIYEKLPVPFGLVRYGVAPDHPEVKNVEHTFTKTALHPNVQFYGNIALGRDVSLQTLRESYHAVVLTYGVHKHKKLNIPGEDLKNVIAAKNIVGWYNGIPEDSQLPIDLSGSSVAIFGQGNVAIDVARILLSPVDLLSKTDITTHSLQLLSESKVKEVRLIGRRGPLQAAFTIKELREMLKLPGCSTMWTPEDFKGLPPVESLARPRRRLTELMLKSLETKRNELKTFRPMFFRSPLEIRGCSNRVSNVHLGVNILEGDLNSPKVTLTSNRQIIDAQLVVTSIGYQSIQLDPNIPFDKNKGVTINQFGKIEEGLYSSGWLASGPTGVILTTMQNAFATAEIVSKDLLNMSRDLPGSSHVLKEVHARNVQVVNWYGWMKINQYEEEQGRKCGKPREKLVDIKKMLEIAM